MPRAFSLANFKDQLILTQRGHKAAQVEFDRALASTAEACKGKDKDFTEKRYVALESGCTTLKRAMEAVSDKNRAQRYFKFELLARQKRPSTPRLLKLFTRFYGLTADYGGSIWKPLVSLGLLWLSLTFIYGVNAHIAGVDLSPRKEIVGALDFSATHIFRPLFIWSKTEMGDARGWLAQYRAGLSAGGWLSIKLLATVQSFLSLTLLFLFGLATKRKFQIS